MFFYLPLCSNPGVTPTPGTPSQPLPVKSFEGVGVRVDLCLPWGYPCHSLPNIKKDIKFQQLTELLSEICPHTFPECMAMPQKEHMLPVSPEGAFSWPPCCAGRSPLLPFVYPPSTTSLLRDMPPCYACCQFYVPCDM
jgi:hypothetical protein